MHGGLWWWSGYGASNSGIILLPVSIGIAMLFRNGGSVLGWLLAGGGIIAIFVGVIARMQLYFRPQSLLQTLLMLALIAAGLGLIARSVRAH